jgi:hypothetical protein
MNKQNKNNINQPPNYQISGIEPNYTYKGKQGLPFDQSSISTSGYSNDQDLANAVNQQQQYVSNYNSYKPLSTFDTPETNSAQLENLRNFSQFGIQKGFETNKPIMFMPDTKNKHETLYDNLNENLLKESLKEYRLNIDSIDRDIRIYPDPFNYIVSLGPVTNSGIPDSNLISKSSSIKAELKAEMKNQKKKSQNIQKNYLEQEEKRLAQLEYRNDYLEINQNDQLVFDNPDAIKEYTLNLERSFNPYIIRDFKNINYIKLDCVVIPKYTSICINENWNFCRKYHHKKNVIRDEYDRIKDYIILNDRYIPNEKDEYNPLGDRFVQIFIKELQSTRNFGTNPTTDKSFILIFDKVLGALYLKLIPYSATKVYKESLLGNLTKLSIQFFNSWGEPLKINTECIDYEINQISNTDLIEPSKYNILRYVDKIQDMNKFKKITKYFNEIIKCFVMVNSNIQQVIPFYTPVEFNHEKNKIIPHEDCLDYKEIELNDKIFEIKNIFHELDSFVSSDGFIEKIKISKINSKRVKLSIDEYLNNIIWYGNDSTQIEKIILNIKALDHNYKNFGFKILDILKTEIINIPTNRNFQNFLTFLLGIWEDELNTKIDYYN